MIVLITSLIFIFIVSSIIQKMAIDRDNEIKFNLGNGFRFLWGWMIFGFFTRFDYSTAYGCTAGFELFLDFKNIVFSLSSLALIYWAYKTENLRLKKIICTGELFYWIFKLIVFKGGYAVGFGGGADSLIVIYDMISIFARLFIIGQLLSMAASKFFKTAIILIGCFILGIKMTYFAMPLNMLYEYQNAKIEIQDIRKEITGYWKGKVTKWKIGNVKELEKDKLEFEKITQLRIDSEYIFLENIKGLENRYKLFLEYHDTGDLSIGKYYYYRITINKLEQDSLVLTLRDFDDYTELGEKYELRLKRE